MKASQQLSEHARMRTFARRISDKDISIALEVGRRIYTKHAVFYLVGRKEVNRRKELGRDLSKLEGVQVVCTPKDEVVKTAYRNRDFRKLRPHRRMRRAHFCVKFRLAARPSGA